MDSTILIADDSEMNRDILKMLFQDKYTVLEACNGKEALDTIESCKTNLDLILLDLFMPDMNGFELLEKRRELEYARNIPVVVITGSGAVDDQLRAFQLGANDYVNKPFVPGIVLSRVENVIASHRRLMSVELEAARLKSKAELDLMTSLYNKMTSELLIDNVLHLQDNELHALILIDIDNFKSVNDLSGHQAGDHTIRIVANLISGQFRKSDIIGRVGGDEFIVLMRDIPSADVARTKVNELIQLMKYKPNLTLPENVTLSIGFVMNEKRPTDYEAMFKKADEALYLAKNAGKARYQEYGVEPVSVAGDKRPVATLLSRNRSICSTVNALIPPEVRIAEALDMTGARNLCAAGDTVLLYADATDTDIDPDAFWCELAQIKGITMQQVIAICPEGELADYRAAMNAGVADILTAPLDNATFKRRTLRYLVKNHIVNE